MNKITFKSHWNKYNLSQQPQWPNKDDYLKVIKKLSLYPKLVNTNEILLLKDELKLIHHNQGFVIQAGDCAETFKNFSAGTIKNKLNILLQMSAIIQYTTKIPITIIGRLAGQYIKPRSSHTETRSGVTLPSYRGDGVNSINFNLVDRTPNPRRLITAYHQSASTMNLLRTLIMEGFTHINQIQAWERIFLENAALEKKYIYIVDNIRQLLNFAETSGNLHPSFKNFYTSHESILLDYENAFIYEEKKEHYCGSGHMLWIGDRTREKNSAHIKFASLISNPIGVKIGPNIKIDDLNYLCEKINPFNKEGKLIFIIRLGLDKIEDILPKLINKIQYYGHNVLWFCDPMHGNTIRAKNGYKTRNFTTIINEIKTFFQIHQTFNTVPGGIHLELTGDNVTECLGGINNIKDTDLDVKYETTCDPRLNNEQSLEVAFLIADLLKTKKE